MVAPKVQFCAKGSEASGESPVGSAWNTPELLVCELPLPWESSVLSSRNIPAGLADMVDSHYERKGYGWGLVGFAPDEAWSVPGMFRVMHGFVREESIGRFDCRTYLIPESALVETLDSLLHGNLDQAESYLQSDDDVRDVLLCTHGAVDACCAKFGYPMYALMRKMADNPGSQVRVWRATHFGGHRFAPTFLEMPSGRYWGRIQPQEASALIHHAAPASDFRHLYRGSATLSDTLHQAIEGELLALLDWDLDSLDIRSIDVEETGAGTWRATAVIVDALGQENQYEIICHQTGEITVKGHCKHDIEITNPQFSLISRAI